VPEVAVKESEMSSATITGLIICSLLLIYLTVALLKPEKF
jgi:K+-transporting ATPase KdpF subunit